MTFSFSICIANSVVPKWGKCDEDDAVQVETAYGPLVGDHLLDELSNCYLPRREERKRKI